MKLPKLYNISAQAGGFTLIELVMIILLVSVLSVVAVVKWPTGMDVSAATLEFKQAVRYTQHMALTREWIDSSRAWGMVVIGDKYYIGRNGANCTSSCSNADCAEVGYCGRSLLGNSSLTLSSAVIYFNGLGEPIATDGSLLIENTTFTIGGSVSVTVCQQTGYVLEGATCP